MEFLKELGIAANNKGTSTGNNWLLSDSVEINPCPR